MSGKRGGILRSTIHEECVDYMDNVLPEDCHATQRIETRRAFWAGAVASFRLVMLACDLPEAEAEAKLLEMGKAFREFKA